MRVIVAGSRSIGDYSEVEKAIKESGFTVTELVEGGAKGVDALGKKWAEANNIPVTTFQAKWKEIDRPGARVRRNEYGQYNALAGLWRNEDMAKYVAPDGALILVWDGKSKGAEHMKQTAEVYRLKTYVHIVE
jgi:hypothetical protein